ncbi:MAG: hypothetical protein H0T92_07590 [Pyrinomonadaceae bacterium]|nr:hypothetical protein [Pyrinomonadaceae bacterium]
MLHAGIVDPTPLSDAASGVISLGRSNSWGAGISAGILALVLGDLAKAGKLKKFVTTPGAWGRCGGHTLEKHIDKSEACLMYQPKTGKRLP